MKIALIGYGKMGKLLEKMATDMQHTIVSKFDSKKPLQVENSDICIDFSHPHAVLHNIKCVAEQGKNIVVGTTGWYEHLPEVKEIVKANKIGFLYAPNFSIGVSLFLQIVEEAAKLFNHHSEYDVGGHEMHHKHKADFPSGTAQAMAKTLVQHIQRKTEPVYHLKDQKLQPHELHIGGTRCGQIPGTHSVIFDSPVDTITITHEAHNREGFALGAIKAAEWLHEKKGFYEFKEMFT